MRYRVKGVEIRTENAAKPATDAARAVVEWLSERKPTTSALDYGCGKLRYSAHVASRSRVLGLVDSKVQLSRVQRIGEESTTIRELAKKAWPHCEIQELEEFWDKPIRRYGFILCANVLSAIPSARVRSRSLHAIHDALAAAGRVLFVNQHTNSYFSEVRSCPTTVPHLDGWLAKTRHRAAYYGVLNQEAVVRMVARYGFEPGHSWVQGQSNFVLATRRRK